MTKIDPEPVKNEVTKLTDIAKDTLKYLENQLTECETIRPFIGHHPDGTNRTTSGIVLSDADVAGEIVTRYYHVQLKGFIDLFEMYLREASFRSVQFLARTVIEAGVERSQLLFGDATSDEDKLTLKALYAVSDQTAGAFPRTSNITQAKRLGDLKLIYKLAKQKGIVLYQYKKSDVLLAPIIQKIITACESVNEDSFTKALEELRRTVNPTMARIRADHKLERYPKGLPFIYRTIFRQSHSTISDALHGAGMSLTVFSQHREKNEMTRTNLGILVQCGLSMAYWVDQFLATNGKSTNEEEFQRICQDYNSLS